MYTSIPNKELPQVLEEWCSAFNVDHTTKLEILSVTKLILRQNYYEFQNKTYKQSNGLPMGAPSSSILSELFLQHLENTVIYDTLCAENIDGYFRYVYDVLIIYRHDITNIERVLDKFNSFTTNLNFTMEREQNSQLNVLDLTISRRRERIEVCIYRKPTTTDVILAKNSCHPHQHKMAAPRYFLNRVNTYDIEPSVKTK
jgi:hypothetical protein